MANVTILGGGFGDDCDCRSSQDVCDYAEQLRVSAKSLL